MWTELAMRGGIALAVFVVLFVAAKIRWGEKPKPKDAAVPQNTKDSDDPSLD